LKFDGFKNSGSTKDNLEHDARLANALDRAMILPVQDVTLRMEFSSGAVIEGDRRSVQVYAAPAQAVRLADGPLVLLDGYAARCRRPV
jgi:hypothetical protein